VVLQDLVSILGDTNFFGCKLLKVRNGVNETKSEDKEHSGVLNNKYRSEFTLNDHWLVGLGLSILPHVSVRRGKIKIITSSMY
jgi:hypothetical protein